MRYKICLAFLILTLLPVYAQEGEEVLMIQDTLESDRDFFEGDEPLEMRLRFNLRQYQREKNQDAYRDAELILRVGDSIEIQRTVRIKPRGKFRREFCSIAPFWLNIRKSGVNNVHLREVKRMKVVTACQHHASHDDYILKEYLAYKLYQVLTPESFRVRLLRMTYVDTGRKDRERTGWAFIIEPEAMMAERLGGQVVKNDQLAMRHMRQDELLRVALFQYMIGNGDYSISGRHNVKLLGLGNFGQEGYTPVPYDFDYTGIVDAEYATPGEHLGTVRITDRYYLGPCVEEAEFEEAMAGLESHREQLLQLIHDFPYLEPREREKMADYIASYFSSAATPRFISRQLNSTCR